jgi:hypothetical protein
MSEPPVPTPGKKLSPLMITLIAVGGALLLAVIALTFLLIGQNTASGNASSPTPTGVSNSPTPVAEPTESEAPEPEESHSSGSGSGSSDKSTHFTSFTAATSVVCDNDAEEKPKIQVSWQSANAVSAYFAPDNGDASDGTGYQVPVSGNQDDITTNDHEFPCAHRGEQDYTITLVGPKGERVSKHWTVVDPAFGN